jgi:hypothetical protein
MQDGVDEQVVPDVVTQVSQAPSTVPTTTSMESTPGVESVMVKGESRVHERS